MADAAPRPGDVRIIGTGAAHTTRVEVLTEDGNWQPLRGVVAYRISQGAGPGPGLPKVTVELDALALAGFEQYVPREQVALRLAGVDDAMLEEARRQRRVAKAWAAATGPSE
jgi:hypothetical protein